MALSRKTDETPKHVTPLRIGERVVEVILGGGSHDKHRRSVTMEIENAREVVKTELWQETVRDALERWCNSGGFHACDESQCFEAIYTLAAAYAAEHEEHGPSAEEAAKDAREDRDRLVREWAVMARACGNWRTWPGKAESDHDHPDWQVAARAICERDKLKEELAAAAKAVAIMSERECRAWRERDQLIAKNLDSMRAMVRAGIAVMGDRLKDKSDKELAALWVDATCALPVAFHCLTSETIRRLTSCPASE